MRNNLNYLLLIALNIFALLLMNKIVFADTIKVAVIDTGKPIKSLAPACETGHASFVEVKPGEEVSVYDTHGHASHVSDLVDQQVRSVFGERRNGMYCMVFLKYFSPDASGAENLKASNKALQKALDLEVDVIVYAGGGGQAHPSEKALVKKALTKGIQFVAAAGNLGQDLEEFPFYPASYYPEVIVVGNVEKSPLFNRTSRNLLSNYGKSVDVSEYGTNVFANVKGQLVPMTGTSQATGIHAGKLVVQMLKERNRK
jgi:subtilisin family serine protease